MNILSLFGKKDKNCLYVNVSLQNADLNYKIGHYKTAFTTYLQLAEQGHAESQFKLGKLYYYGKGTYKDEEQAIFWIKKADQQKYPQATFFLNKIHTPKEYSSKELSLQISEVKTAIYHLTKESNLKYPISTRLLLTGANITFSFSDWIDSKTSSESISNNNNKNILSLIKGVIIINYIIPKILKIAGIKISSLYQPTTKPIPLFFNRGKSLEEESIIIYERIFYALDFIDDNSILNLLRIFGRKQQDLLLAYKTHNKSDFLKKARGTDPIPVIIYTIYELNKSENFEREKQELYKALDQNDCISLEEISTTINKIKESVDIIISLKNSNITSSTKIRESLPNERLCQAFKNVFLFFLNTLFHFNNISSSIKNEIYSLIEEYNFCFGGLTKEFETELSNDHDEQLYYAMFYIFYKGIDDYIEEFKSPLKEKHDLINNTDDVQSNNLENEGINKKAPNEKKIHLYPAISIQTLINSSTKNKSERDELYHLTLKYLYQYLTETNNFKNKIMNKEGEIIKNSIDCIEKDFMYILGDPLVPKENTSENPVINWNEGEKNSMRGFFYALYSDLDKPISEVGKLNIGPQDNKLCYAFQGVEIKLSENKNSANEAKKQWTAIIRECTAEAKKELGLAS